VSGDALYESLALWSQVGGSIAFFVCVIWLWVRFLAPAVRASQERKNAELADAERRRDEAKAAVATAETQIARADADAAAIAARAERDAAELRQRLVLEARSDGRLAIEHAEGELERGRTAGREQLRSELLWEAMRIARDAAGRIDDATNRRLVNEAVRGADGERGV
jgi:F0F1-type ATP synthase membrane subunit b/b'